MSKPPKEQARDYVWHNYGEGDFNEHNWDRSAEEIWLAGYKAGREITDQEIVDILVDIRDREAKERSRAPVWKQERHDRIWEKIKIKLVGIF